MISPKFLSKILSNQTGQVIKVQKIEPYLNGYQSLGFKVITEDKQTFFLKKSKRNLRGFEFCEKELASLLISDGMQARSGKFPKNLGVILEQGDQLKVFDPLNEETELYQLQEFDSGGKSYTDILEQSRQKKKVDQTDLKYIEGIVDFISDIHKIKHPDQDTSNLNLLYNDSLRSMVIHPEITISLLSDFLESHKILPLKDHGEYLGLMLEHINDWKDRGDRLRALHGDFWSGNVFIKKNGTITAIDYSRIPWGDPGIDIGWWMGQYLWYFYDTKNPYFKDLGILFLEQYEKKTGDKEIRKTICLSLAVVAIIYLSPVVHPKLPIKTARPFFEFIKKSLKKGVFDW